MPDPPIKHLPPPNRRRPKLYANDDQTTTEQQQQHPKNKSNGITGVAAYLPHFEPTLPPPTKPDPTPATIKLARSKQRIIQHGTTLAPLVDEYRTEQRDSSGECNGMNCYNTLFVGRLAHEVTERKLLREFEAFGPVKDVKLVTTTTNSTTAGEEGKMV